MFAVLSILFSVLETITGIVRISSEKSVIPKCFYFRQLAPALAVIGNINRYNANFFKKRIFEVGSKIPNQSTSCWSVTIQLFFERQMTLESPKRMLQTVFF